MSSKTASKVSVFDFMSDDHQDAVLNLMIEVESRILEEVRKVMHRPRLASLQKLPQPQHMSLNLITLIEGVLRLDSAASHGVFISDAARRRVFNSIVKDTLGHTRADKPR